MSKCMAWPRTSRFPFKFNGYQLTARLRRNTALNLIYIYELRQESRLRNPCAAVRAFLNRNHDDPEKPGLHGERFSADGAAPDLLHRGFRDLQPRKDKENRERDPAREPLYRKDRG